ncbi:PAS domain S-box protein, partial [Nitrospira sp. BLG_2]|uniref:PAS domain S-box protein n=1 Tax=Nitrospira sp. BLG_2 TaxID=3397507 RepID=UPI003B99D0FD
MSPSPTTATILIVDHDPITMSMKRRLLSRQSYRIIEAENGADALMLATAELPDLVLLDANLPDIDSFDACRQLKTRSETKFVKILQTSAARMNGPDRMKGLEMGADTYLVEPAEEELIGTVRALLKLAKQERDNIRLAEKLSRAERQLSAATEAVHCAIWDWDIAADRVEWWGGINGWAGLPSGSFGEKMEVFIDLLHPDDRPRVRQKLEQAMAGRAIDYADEYRFRHPNGNLHYLHAGGRFHYDGQGKAIRMTGIVQDMTERKRAEVAVRENEERFAKAFRTSPHPIGITEVATGRCLEVNDACLQLFGFRREEVIGSTTLMLGIWPNQEDRARLIQRVQAGEPVRNLEFSFKTKSGGLRHILVSS